MRRWSATAARTHPPGNLPAGARCCMPALFTRMSIGLPAAFEASTAAADAFVIGGVKGQSFRPRNARGGGGQLGRIAPVQHHLRARSGQPFGQRKADALRRSRDQRAPPGQIEKPVTVPRLQLSFQFTLDKSGGQTWLMLSLTFPVKPPDLPSPERKPHDQAPCPASRPLSGMGIRCTAGCRLYHSSLVGGRRQGRASARRGRPARSSAIATRGDLGASECHDRGLPQA